MEDGEIKVWVDVDANEIRGDRIISFIFVRRRGGVLLLLVSLYKPETVGGGS